MDKFFVVDSFIGTSERIESLEDAMNLARFDAGEMAKLKTLCSHEWWVTIFNQDEDVVVSIDTRHLREMDAVNI